MFAVHTELQALAAKLHAEQIPYALCGALALAVHGYPRATLDIDLLALTGSGDRIRDCARTLGFTLEAAPMEFIGGAVRIKRLSKVLPTSEDVLMLDVLSVSPEIENEMVVELLNWEGRPLRTVDRARQDLADLEKLR